MTKDKTVIKLRSGGLMYPVTTWVSEGRRYFQFAFNNYLKNEVKAMDGARWSPETKSWHVLESHRNTFQLRYLMNEPVYAKYDEALNLEIVPKTRFNTKFNKEMPLFKHQVEGTAFTFQRHYSILAAEMGLGKSLMALHTAELAMAHYTDSSEWWFVAPKSALYAVQRDFRIWSAKLQPTWLTYEGFTKELKNWRAGRKAPFGVIFDEFSRCKNLKTQRSQAAESIANGIREDHGDRGYVIGMTGTPSPKSPADWWSEAEIICPGFIREGNVEKFKQRLAIITMKEGIDGGSYPQLISWKDNEKKCDICGQFADHANHMMELSAFQKAHPYVQSKNEVALLAQRLKGLVMVYFKKDCLDLPEKFYEVIEVKPKPSTLRAASLLVRSARTVIEGLTRLRELSDGFQYIDTKIGTDECSVCKGTLKISQPMETPDSCPNCKDLNPTRDSKFDIAKVCGRHQPIITYEEQDCPNCGGKGIVDKFERGVQEVACPKDDALAEILDRYEDVGRLVIYGGFTGTIDRVVKACHRLGWHVIRMDGRGVQVTDPKGEILKITDFQTMFLDQLTEYDKVVFVAHPKSGGMGLTLTSSPAILYYSNDFDAEARIQSEDRIHRPGMDAARGATIIDLIHLPSDLKVLENLKRKRELQSLTLGEFEQALKSEGERPE